MAAAGAPAARCLTVLLTLAVHLGHLGQGLGLQGVGAAAVKPPSNEELTSSLLANQLAILELLKGGSSAEFEPACPHKSGWIRFKSSCYLFDDKQRTWEASRTYCRSLGGDLVKITNEGEQNFIKENIKGESWIGLSDRKQEGHYVWTDGSKPTYTTWKRGQPDNYIGVEHCGELRSSNNYYWNDLDCKARIYCVCQQPIDD